MFDIKPGVGVTTEQFPKPRIVKSLGSDGYVKLVNGDTIHDSYVTGVLQSKNELQFYHDVLTFLDFLESYNIQEEYFDLFCKHNTSDGNVFDFFRKTNTECWISDSFLKDLEVLGNEYWWKHAELWKVSNAPPPNTKEEAKKFINFLFDNDCFEKWYNIFENEYNDTLINHLMNTDQELWMTPCDKFWSDIHDKWMSHKHEH